MLGQLGLPAGSEVLVSAVTIEDMVTILRHHGLVAVPMDVNPTDMSPSFKDIDRAITSRTKAMLIAHLFGTRLPLQPFAEKAQEHGLLLWEDCAQAFDGRYAGHPEADAVMFSFGPIKTATALGGGLLRVRDRELLTRMRSAQETWPLSNNRSFVSRVARYAVLKFLSGRIAFRVFLAILKLLGRDPDRVLNSAVRNFPGDELIAQLRHRSPTAMLRLLARRLGRFARIGLIDVHDWADDWPIGWHWSWSVPVMRRPTLILGLSGLCSRLRPNLDGRASGRLRCVSGQPIASRPDSGRFIAINAQRRTHHNRGRIPASASRIDGTSSRPAGRHPDFTAAEYVKGLSVGVV